MNIPAYLPTPSTISREALTVICGALIAALIISNVPQLKAYVKAAWA